ncbi:FAD/NAD(P)-binding protein [Mesorhizobium sp. LHD-90]|uniref:FAD/NAD(P)-binding protein n=1 Tax=Mesorhizobium sp. LHD-90 TaxID=3071414 RepID=UPI0027DF2F96|nr:FAD/NAD(P)-binding protein [Mesorhizobium sp. LHD-90]MDQ6437659.1 FAD/NAD(P)-binding protein [Mesorhizobium sp. LHD-90]
MTGRASIVIVGGGASGVLLAAHLLKSPNPDLRVTLIEKSENFGRGRAYSTALPDHVLNVSAMGMSGYADDPEHFWRWVQASKIITDGNPAVYLPRAVYGRYLHELLQDNLQRERETGRLRLVRETCLGVSPTPSGVDVRLANGTSIACHAAVLAVGHDEEPSPEHPLAVRIDSPADTPLDDQASVLILGTGLSMVDAWLTLEHRGHRGKIVAVSRRGLLPSPHRKGNPIRLDVADVPLGTQLSYFVGWLRDLIRATQKAGGDWRDVLDALRPFNQQVWQSWPASAKRRFVEHTKAWWDIHRHRMAPPIYARLEKAVEAGRVRLVAARVDGMQERSGKLAVRLKHRRSQTLKTLVVDRVYDCTGITKDLSTGSIAVVRDLIDRGFARPDPLKLGLDVTESCAVIGETGSVSDKLFAVGPLTRGAFFEIEAIPDIRAQCARLAKVLAGG